MTWIGLTGLLLRNLAQSRSIDIDVFHAMSVFREAVSSRRFPLDDVFAYTPTIQPVVHHEWGTGAILYAFWEGFGLGPLGVGLVRYALIAVLLAVAWACARIRGATASSIAVAGSLALLMLSVGLAPVRAQMFTFVFAAVLLLFLELDARGARWWIPIWLALCVVWVNLHGGIAVGAGIVTITALERFVSGAGRGAAARLRSVRHLLLVAAGMGAALFLTPYGLDYPRYLWRALSMQRSLVSEWAALWDPAVAPGLVAAYALSVAFVAYAIKKGATRTSPGLPVVLVFAVAALLSQRHVALYAIAWFAWTAPALARTELGRMVAGWYSRFPAAVAAVLLLCAMVGAAKTIAGRSWDVIVPGVAGEARLYPVAATERLARAAFSGNLMTSFEDGSYVSWRLYPDVKVSLDSRYEAAFPRTVVLDHVRFFAAAPQWSDILTRYATDAVLIPRTAPVSSAMEASEDIRRAWKRVYADASHSLYVRIDRVAKGSNRD